MLSFFSLRISILRLKGFTLDVLCKDIVALSSVVTQAQSTTSAGTGSFLLNLGVLFRQQKTQLKSKKNHLQSDILSANLKVFERLSCCNLIMARGRKAKAKTADKNKDAEDEPTQSEEVDQKESIPKAKGKKRAANDEDGEQNSDSPKPKLKKQASSISDSLGDVDSSMSSKASSGKASNFKIASWNINGVRAWLAKDGPSYLKKEEPDVLCVQELKCDISKIPSGCSVDGYSNHWHSGETEGYSGVGMYFKTKPLNITEGIGIKKHDNEGRVITAEFEKFYLVNTYIPNSGRGLVRHKYRTEEWDIDFLEYLKTLDKTKPVIWCGDLNVAHQEIDIKNAKGNKKNAGFTKEERDNFGAVLDAGFIDAFRQLYPDQEHAYSFWAYFMNARAKNVGWRLDYFVMSERMKENLGDSIIRSKVMGSDHCPIVLELAL